MSQTHRYDQVKSAAPLPTCEFYLPTSVWEYRWLGSLPMCECCICQLVCGMISALGRPFALTLMAQWAYWTTRTLCLLEIQDIPGKHGLAPHPFRRTVYTVHCTGSNRMFIRSPASDPASSIFHTETISYRDCQKPGLIDLRTGINPTEPEFIQTPGLWTQNLHH